MFQSKEALQAAIKAYQHALNLLQRVTVDISHLEISEAGLQAKLDEAHKGLCDVLLADAEGALVEEEYEDAKRLAKEGMDAFPDVPRFGEILDEASEEDEKIEERLSEAEMHIQRRARFERNELDIERANRAIASAEELLVRIQKIRPHHPMAERLLEQCHDWNRATAEVAQGQELQQNDKTDRAREVIADVLDRFPNRADARKLKESLDSITPIGGKIRLLADMDANFIIIPVKAGITIGSASGNDIVLEGDFSRKQAKISRRGGRYMLTHLSERCPTAINGETIRDKASLSNGDEIDFNGRLRFRFYTPADGGNDSATFEPNPEWGTPDTIYVLMNRVATFGEYRPHKAAIGLTDRSLKIPHARLLYERGSYWLEPIAPIEHDGQPCNEKTPLHHDSRMTIGETEIRVEAM